MQSSHICHELKHQRGEYQEYEILKLEVVEIQMVRMWFLSHCTSSIPERA